MPATSRSTRRAREVEREAVDEIDEKRRSAEVIGMDRQADELEDAEIGAGASARSFLPRSGDRRGRSATAGARRSPAPSLRNGRASWAVGLDAIGSIGGRRRLVAGRRRREQRHRVLGRQEVEHLQGPDLVSAARRPGVAGGDEEELHPRRRLPALTPASGGGRASRAWCGGSRGSSRSAAPRSARARRSRRP